MQGKKIPITPPTGEQAAQPDQFSIRAVQYLETVGYVITNDPGMPLYSLPDGRVVERDPDDPSIMHHEGVARTLAESELYPEGTPYVEVMDDLLERGWIRTTGDLAFQVAELDNQRARRIDDLIAQLPTYRTETGRPIRTIYLDVGTGGEYGMTDIIDRSVQIPMQDYAEAGDIRRTHQQALRYRRAGLGKASKNEPVRWITVQGKKIPITTPTGKQPLTAAAGESPESWEWQPAPKIELEDLAQLFELHYDLADAEIKRLRGQRLTDAENVRYLRDTHHRNRLVQQLGQQFYDLSGQAVWAQEQAAGDTVWCPACGAEMDSTDPEGIGLDSFCPECGLTMSEEAFWETVDISSDYNPGAFAEFQGMWDEAVPSSPEQIIALEYIINAVHGLYGGDVAMVGMFIDAPSAKIKELLDQAARGEVPTRRYMDEAEFGAGWRFKVMGGHLIKQAQGENEPVRWITVEGRRVPIKLNMGRRWQITDTNPVIAAIEHNEYTTLGPLSGNDLPRLMMITPDGQGVYTHGVVIHPQMIIDLMYNPIIGDPEWVTQHEQLSQICFEELGDACYEKEEMEREAWLGLKTSLLQQDWIRVMHGMRNVFEVDKLTRTQAGYMDEVFAAAPPEQRKDLYIDMKGEAFVIPQQDYEAADLSTWKAVQQARRYRRAELSKASGEEPVRWITVQGRKVPITSLLSTIQQAPMPGDPALSFDPQTSPFSDDYLQREVDFYGEVQYNHEGITVDMDSPQGRVDDYLNVNFLTGDIAVPILRIDGHIWMSLTRMEVQSMALALRRAQGRVLVGGLGMGYFALRAASKPEVDAVEVWETDPRIIQYFETTFAERPEMAKITIHEGNALAALEQYAQGEQDYDYAFMDIWDVVAADDIVELAEEYGDSADYWSQERFLLEAMNYGADLQLRQDELEYFAQWIETEDELGELFQPALDEDQAIRFAEAVVRKLAANRFTVRQGELVLHKQVDDAIEEDIAMCRFTVARGRMVLQKVYDPHDSAGWPDRVKKLPAKQGRRWVHVWNSVYADTDDEGRAFAAANSQVPTGKKKTT